MILIRLSCVNNDITIVMMFWSKVVKTQIHDKRKTTTQQEIHFKIEMALSPITNGMCLFMVSVIEGSAASIERVTHLGGFTAPHPYPIRAHYHHINRYHTALLYII